MSVLTIRIVIADDHAVLRSGLRLLLTSQTNYQVVGEAGTGAATLRVVEQCQPDLLLLDLSMPGLGGLDTLPLLRRCAPDTKILILTMHDDPQYLRQALKQGVCGYVLKKAADSELLTAIRVVLSGELYIQPSMTRTLLDDLLPKTAESGNQQDLWDGLSEREQEVLKAVAFGYTSIEIAEQLALSAKTVDTYRARGMEKLGLRNRASLVRFALKRGIISA